MGPIKDGVFKCKKCGYEEYYKNKDRKSCVKCHKEKMKEYYATENYKKHRRQRHVWETYKYKITQQDYEQMTLKQEYKCKICGKKPLKLHIDHNHKTKEIRGLLCQSCNHGLGNFKDSIINLESAIKYLKKNIKKPVASPAKITGGFYGREKKETVADTYHLDRPAAVRRGNSGREKGNRTGNYVRKKSGGKKSARNK